MGSVEIGSALIGDVWGGAMRAGPGLAARINGARGNVRCQDPDEWAVVCEQIDKRERSLPAQRVRQTACGIVKASPDVFSAEVIPILQRRGLFRTEYTGAMLREHYGSVLADQRLR